MNSTILNFMVGVTVICSIPALAEGPGELAKPTAQTEAPSTSSKVRKIPSRAEDRDNERVLNGILKDAGWFPDLKVAVRNGLVFIDGHAADGNHLQWLINTADRLPGTLAVVNRAEVDKAVSDFSPAKKEIRRLIDLAKTKLPLFGVGVILIFVFAFLGRLLSRGTRRLWQSQIDNPFLVSVVNFISLVPIYIVMLYMALATMGLSGLASTIIGGTGILGIVMGFAFKGIAENFLSGLLLAIRSPFTEGDTITIDKHTGVVQNLNMRGTTIMDFDGNLVLIPNATIIQSVVTNSSANPKSRSSFVIGIALSASVEKAEAIVRETIKEIPEILEDPAPLVAAENVGDSAILLKIYYWVDTQKSSAPKVKSRAIALCKSALLANEIEIPDQAREIIFRRESHTHVPQQQSDLHTPPENSSGADSSETSVRKMAKVSRLPGDEHSASLLKPGYQI